MDLNSLVRTVSKVSKNAAAKIQSNPESKQMLDQAIQGAKQFGSSEEGLYRAIDAVGGAPMVNRISTILDRNPAVKIAVSGILSSNGLSINKIKDRFGEPRRDQSPSNQRANQTLPTRQASTPVNSYREKLDRMK